MHKSALFAEDRVAKYNEIEPLVLPTQLPSDSDESNDELSKENAICHRDNRVPLVTSNSYLKNVQNVRMWSIIYNFHFILMRSSAFISFVFIIEDCDEQWKIVHGEFYM